MAMLGAKSHKYVTYQVDQDSNSFPSPLSPFFVLKIINQSPSSKKKPQRTSKNVPQVSEHPEGNCLRCQKHHAFASYNI